MAVRILTAERIDRDGKPEAAIRVRFPGPLTRPVYLVGLLKPAVLTATPRGVTN